MRTCNSVIVAGPGCPGHGRKLDSCLDEALYGWACDEAFHEREDATGDVDFEGRVTAIIVKRDEVAELDDRQVEVPADNYLVWMFASGAVAVTTVGTAEEAREIIAVNAARYDLWEHGCDPDRPDDHEQCADADQCRIPEWMDA